ncbi:hypothetical protein CVIRNUC_006281 [Coccomyxa viridis]|uniref:Protein kinase domain-containing protein n=1 Tax=Coccomyxa viridis TaxID=1274662 RepID=A0AAV1I878_9CHLO|nr:hypothetical protein CVIRNUC_006281 [Coccomyxa viridis]
MAASLSSKKSQREIQLEYPLSAEEYELIGEPIGKGGSATVYLARCKPLSATVAVKLVDLEELASSLELLIREAQTMKGLRHPNVLPLHCSFVAQSALWLVMPYIGGGSVLELLRSQFPKGMEEDMILTIAKDVLSGLQYLHRAGLAHRDLKAENLLVAEDGRVLLADFGATARLEHARYSLPAPPHSDSSNSLSNISDSDASVNPSAPSSDGGSTPSLRMERAGSSWSKYLSRQTFVGTPNYMAPEIMVQSEEGYNQSADIWSFGMVLLELARGKVPLAGCSFTKIILDTVHGDAPSLQTCGCTHKYSKGLDSMVAACLNKDANQRPTAAELLKDPVLKHGHDHKWLAKRLAALERDRSSRRVSFRDGSSTAHSGSQSPHHTPPTQHRHSLFTRHSSKTLPTGNGSTQGSSHGDKAAKTVHHLAWAFDLEHRPYVLVYELTQWFGKARIFVDGVELLVKRYSFLQQISFASDNYTVKVDNESLGPLHGCTIQLKVATHLGVQLLGRATVDGRVLPAPIYCEHESLRGSASGKAPSLSESPLSPLEMRPSVESLRSADSASPTATSVEPSQASKQALQKTSLTSIPESHVPKAEPSVEPVLSFTPPGKRSLASPFGAAVTEDEQGMSPPSAAQGDAIRGNDSQANSSKPDVPAPLASGEAAEAEDAAKAPQSNHSGDNPSPKAEADDTNDESSHARMQAAVRREVDAAVERLRAEYAKRESMLMRTVMSHAERERDLVERIATLERKLNSSTLHETSN